MRSRMQRALLDLEIWCPWSGSKLGEIRIAPHKIQVMRCANGTLFAICQLHKTRTFTGDLNTIAKVMKIANVLDITEKPSRRIYHNRGPRNEISQKAR